MHMTVSLFTLILFTIVPSYYVTCQYVPSYLSCSMTACDVLTMVREDLAERTDDKQLREMKEKLEHMKNVEYDFHNVKFELMGLREEFNTFVEKFQTKPEIQSDGETSTEERLSQVEKKVEKSMEQIGQILSLKEEIQLLKHQIQVEKEKNEKLVKENEELRLREKLLVFEELKKLESNDQMIQQEFSQRLNQRIEFLQEKIEKENEELTTNLTAISLMMIEQQVMQMKETFNSSFQEMRNLIEEKAFEQDLFNFENATRKMEIETKQTLMELENDVGIISAQTSKILTQMSDVKKQLFDDTTLKKEIQKEMKNLEGKVTDLEFVNKEMNEKLAEIQNIINKLKEKEDLQMDSSNNNYPPYIVQSEPTQEACVYYNYSSDIVASLNGRPITTSIQIVPHGKTIVFRCRDPGLFKLHGSITRYCNNGSLSGVQPICGPLVVLPEMEDNIMPDDENPSIVIEPKPDSFFTNIMPDGTILVKPGSKVILACQFPLAKNNLQWYLRNSQMKPNREAVISAKWNSENTRYEIIVNEAKESDSGNYTCVNDVKNRFERTSHTISLLVQQVTCPPIMDDKLRTQGQMHRIVNSEIRLQCTELNLKLVWPSEGSDNNRKLKCLPSGVWSSEWPKCERRTTSQPVTNLTP